MTMSSMSAILQTLNRIHRTHTSGSAVDSAELDPEFDFLDAVIPPTHEGRATLLQLRDEYRWWHSPIAHEDGADTVGMLLHRLRDQVEATPIDVPIWATATGIRQVRSYWHESGIAVRVTGLGQHGTAEVDNAFGASSLEVCLVFTDCDTGDLVGIANLATVLDLAAHADGKDR